MECVIEEFALTVPFETYFSNIGRPFVEILSTIGITEYQLDIERRYNELAAEAVDQITIFSGAQDLLNFLEDNQILISVTSKQKERTKKILELITNSHHPNSRRYLPRKASAESLLMAAAIENVTRLKHFLLVIWVLIRWQQASRL